MDILVSEGYDIIYYNTASFAPPEEKGYRFIAYPSVADGYDAGNIKAGITYFQFAGLLIDTTAGLMDFLLAEGAREKPDVIFHSHLAVWGKLIARHFGLPAVNLNTVIVMDRQVMLPYFRKLRQGAKPEVTNMIDAVGILRKRSLFTSLGFADLSDLWDVYVNKGELNICLFPDFLQPERNLLDKSYVFTGCPFDHRPAEEEKTLVYMAMGTILNEDISFYRWCISLLEEMELPALLSVGNKIDIGSLRPVKDFVKVVRFTDQPEVLKRSRLFISRGGMASLLEAIQTLTPMIVIPIIPEQRLNAEKVAELGIGLNLSGPVVDEQALRAAILEILGNAAAYRQRLSSLAKEMDPIAARRSLLQTVNEFFQPATVVDLFLRQVKAAPDAIALWSEEEELTYCRLDERSSQLALRLRAAGVQRGGAVPVLMAHGVGMVIAMLGIMRLGGAYVPVDPDYPEERLTYLLQDVGGRVAVSDPEYSGRLSAMPVVIVIDSADEKTAPVDRQPMNSLPARQDDAYIIYTSGSTGRPKGVVVGHGQLYRYLLDIRTNMELEECHSYAMLGTFAADAGLTAIFSALCFGGRLDLLQVKKMSSRERLRTHFSSHPIDCYKITPSLLGLLLQDADMEVILPRKRLILGGESCPWQLAFRVHALLPERCVLYNHYGPTETTIGVLTYRFPHNKEEFPAVIPLGRPLAHVQTCLLDAKMQEAEPGSAAELYIGGELVAKGYLNQPELTAARFLQYQHHGTPGRVYRTGDLVRQLPDGNIAFLGRADDQVKIRGYRIELQEVEQAILAAGHVKNCLVLCRENTIGWKRLVGYVLPDQGYDRAALLTLLRSRLPGYMIPGSWVEMTEWPLTFNNKTDRQAFPATDAEDALITEVGGDTQTVLKNIWSRLLECEVLDTEVELFALGGDSLLLMKLAFEVERLFHIPIPVAELIHNLTIDRMAAWLDGKTATAATAEPTMTTDFDPRQVSLAQRNFFLHKRLHPGESFPNSSICFQVTGELDVQRLEMALEKVIEMHDGLRTAFFLERGQVVRQVCEKAALSLTLVRSEREDIDEEINRMTQPFDFGKPPLMRAFLIRLPGGKKYFYLDMPHIVSDGQSMQVITEDLAGQYNNGCTGGYRPGFTDFQKYFHAYQHSRQYQKDTAFWKERLRNEDILMRLGSPNPWPQPRLAGSGITMTLPAETAGRLNELTRQQGVTRFQFFLAIYYLLLYRVTGQPGLTVMIPVHNRYDKGSERIVGLLANVMPVRIDIEAGWTMAHLLAHCKGRLLTAAAHQQFPFEKMLEMHTRNGGDAKTIMQTFFGWHAVAENYRFGQALFRLHIPSRNKENLPLSVALFDTDPAPTIRFSALLAAYSPTSLKAMAARYIRLLKLILIKGTDTLLSRIEDETASIF